jgi:hypothetical protein
MSEERREGIKVTDRRHFHADGTIRPEVAVEEEQERAQPSLAEPVVSAFGAAAEAKTMAVENPLFLDLVANLIGGAASYLGLAPNPATGQPEVDLDSAKHMINVLTALQEKTKGNLAASEHQLLENALAQLQLAYVRASSSVKQGA